MNRLFILNILCWLLLSPIAARDVGDTLFVAAQSGLNVRDEPGLKGNKISKLFHGDTVVVSEIPEGTEFQQAIEGFSGRWVEVHKVNSDSTGYVFDSFLTRFPLMNPEVAAAITSKYENLNCVLDRLIDVYISTYLNSDFNKLIEWNNGSDGEGYTAFEIIELKHGVRKVTVSYSEGGYYELEFNGSFLSEIFYLCQNIISLVESSKFSLIKSPFITKDYHQSNCAIKLGDGCNVGVIRKGWRVWALQIYYDHEC